MRIHKSFKDCSRNTLQQIMKYAILVPLGTVFYVTKSSPNA